MNFVPVFSYRSWCGIFLLQFSVGAAISPTFDCFLILTRGLENHISTVVRPSSSFYPGDVVQLWRLSSKSKLETSAPSVSIPPPGVSRWYNIWRLFDEGDVARAGNMTSMAIIHAEGLLVVVVAYQNSFSGPGLKRSRVTFDVHESSRTDDPQL